MEYTVLLQLIIVFLLFQHQLQYFTCNSLSSNYSQYTDSQLSSQLASGDYPYDSTDFLNYSASAMVYDESSEYNDERNSIDSASSFAHTELSPCTYPKGSIACKTWNQTNVDCAGRSLTCIPYLPHAALVELLDLEVNNIEILPDFSFIRFQNLNRLYLGYNEISFIGNNTFSGLYKLKHLDLQYNILRTVSGSPFHGLVSLKILHIFYGAGLWNRAGGRRYYEDINVGKPLLMASLAGLTRLEELQLHIGYFNLIENVSFQESSMLDSLTLKIKHYDVITFPSSVSGLSQLKTLRIDYEAPIIIDLCNFSSLENLYLKFGYIYISKKCNATSLKSFTVEIGTVWYGVDYPLGFERLHNVTSITVTVVSELDTLRILQNLQMLNSPLEKLHIEYGQNFQPTRGVLVFNSTYFQILALFSLSVHELSLSAEFCDIELQGTPFNHFHKLKKLTITGNSLNANNANNVFKGLENLQELEMKGNGFPSHSQIVGNDQFSIFPSLKRVSLSNIDVYYYVSDPVANRVVLVRSFNLWCHFPFLEYIEISNTDSTGLQSFDCAPPHLQTIIANGYGNAFDVNFSCDLAPYLEKIDFSRTIFGSKSNPFVHQQCRVLRFLDLSHAMGFHVPDDVTSDMPVLEELYLSNVYDGTSLAFDVLRSFKAPILRYLDFSDNSISVITKDDAMLLSNLTFLNLTGNALVSFDYVQYLVNIEIFSLRTNFLTTFPKALFDDSSVPFLKMLDLAGNPIVCDCGIQAFQSWIISDLSVRLPFNQIADEARCSYCCASPSDMEGLSVTEIDLDCKSLVWAYIVIGVISAIFLVIVGLLVALYHWNIKNRLFLLFNRRRDPVLYLLDDDDHDDEDENGIPRYDAYVSYCNEDEDWICDELDPTIEGGAEPLRLCIRGRDIPANRPILQSISLYMKRSRKVILILSPRYVDNRGRNQCKFELALAHHRLQEENEKVLILIILEEILDRQMTLMLRQLFNQVVCLKWPGNECEQGLFWQRLREEIKRRVPVDEYYEARDLQAIELQRMA